MKNESTNAFTAYEGVLKSLLEEINSDKEMSPCERLRLCGQIEHAQMGMRRTKGMK